MTRIQLKDHRFDAGYVIYARCKIGSLSQLVVLVYLMLEIRRE